MGLKPLSEPACPTGKGARLRSHESHEPRFENRGMSTPSPSIPTCLGFSRWLPKNCLEKHLLVFSKADLREQLVVSRAWFPRRQRIFHKLITRRAVSPTACPCRHIPPNHYWIIPISMLPRGDVHNNPAGTAELPIKSMLFSCSIIRICTSMFDDHQLPCLLTWILFFYPYSNNSFRFEKTRKSSNKSE